MAFTVVTGHPDEHGGPGCEPPVLVWTDGETFVFVHPDAALAQGLMPVKYADATEAAKAVAAIPCRTQSITVNDVGTILGIVDNQKSVSTSVVS